MKTLSPEIFRAYDIRGLVETKLTPEVVFAIGQAIACEVKQTGQSKIVIGRDGRLSGAELSKALEEGLCDQGLDVLDIGQVPTPLMYFATYHFNIPAGIVLTGSHNPPAYNGLKIVMNHAALWGEAIQNLYHRIKNTAFKTAESLGQVQEQTIDIDYIQYVCDTVTLSRPLKIVIDCGNGVTGKIAPQLYQSLGCEVIPLFCEIDGHFPNHHPDPGQPKNLVHLQQAVMQHQADLGLAFDGDGDRLGVVDNQANIIWPDRQLILFARDILSRHPGAAILYDVKCTRHVAQEIESAKGQAIMYKTGHSLIKAKMGETGALLGGEMSGHIFFKERWFGFDDALYAGARLLELFAQQPSHLSSKTWFDSVPNSENTPELQIAVSEQEKFSYMDKLIQIARFEEAKISTIDGLRVDFSDGFGLIRPSNTSACLVLRFEGDTFPALKRIQDLFRQLLSQVMPHIAAPF